MNAILAFSINVECDSKHLDVSCTAQCTGFGKGKINVYHENSPTCCAYTRCIYAYNAYTCAEGFCLLFLGRLNLFNLVFPCFKDLPRLFIWSRLHVNERPYKLSGTQVIYFYRYHIVCTC